MVSLSPRSAFDGLLQSRGDGPAGVWIQAPAGVSVASLVARKGAAPALAARVRAAWGLELPQGPTFVAKPGVAFVGTGPGAWLAIGYDGGVEPWSARLNDALSECAAVVDQSGGQAAVRLGGPSAADLLSKGAFLDLDLAVFPPTSAAVTLLAHIGVTLWRVGPEDFELAIPRSFAPAFAHWLQSAARQYGLSLRG